MFANSFRFSYSNDIKNKLIGERIFSEDQKEYKNLLIYGGIGLICNYYSDPSDCIEAIKNQTEKNMPVIIRVDGYCIPWDPAYNTYHFRYHTFIAAGIDFKEKMIVCADPMHNNSIGDATVLFKLPIENYIKGCKKVILSLFSTEKCKNIDWQHYIKKAIVRFEPDSQSGGMYGALKNFSHDIKTELDIKKETADYQGSLIWQAPLIHNTTRAHSSRSFFRMFLEYISEKYGVNALAGIINDFKNIEFEWSVFYTALLKSSYTGISNDVKLYDTIDRIAELEKGCITQLKAFV